MKNLFKYLFSIQVKDKAELLALLKDASDRQIIDKDNLSIIEAVLQIERLKAKDIMLPRQQVDVLDINDEMSAIINKIVQTGHSRFPVIDGEIGNIVGIFHAKDLIFYFTGSQVFNLKDHLRQAYFVPEIKRLDGLMYEMRVRQTHMAIVVDEFTNVVGMITLEMIVEQLIGEIEDEYDSIEGEREIIEIAPNSYRVKGFCSLNELNNILGTTWEDNYVETIGGYIIRRLGRIPVVGEIIELNNMTLEVVNSDSRKIKLLTLTKNKH